MNFCEVKLGEEMSYRETANDWPPFSLKNNRVRVSHAFRARYLTACSIVLTRLEFLTCLQREAQSSYRIKTKT